ncbi:MAG: DUF2460 domain-containing protein [Candidatus Omnitrophota bacterium]
MSTEILTFSPAFGLKESIHYNTLIFQADSGREKRRDKWSDGIRTLECSLHEENEAAIDAIWDFFRSRKGKYDTFWVKFPTNKNKVVTAESISAGDGIETVFALDYFPIDVSSVVVYLDGVETEDVTPSNDLTNEVAKLTFSSPPAEGVAITADYEYYIQARFSEDIFSREKIAYALYNASINLVEVLWNTYSAP